MEGWVRREHFFGWDCCSTRQVLTVVGMIDLMTYFILNLRKVLAYVACGRLKSAFQVAAQANNEADVAFIYHEVGLGRGGISFNCVSIAQCYGGLLLKEDAKKQVGGRCCNGPRPLYFLEPR